jgi:hypothetical protein
MATDKLDIILEEIRSIREDQRKMLLNGCAKADSHDKNNADHEARLRELERARVRSEGTQQGFKWAATLLQGVVSAAAGIAGIVIGLKAKGG